MKSRQLSVRFGILAAAALLGAVAALKPSWFVAVALVAGLGIVPFTRFARKLSVPQLVGLLLIAIQLSYVMRHTWFDVEYVPAFKYIRFPLLLHGDNATVSVGYLRSYEGFGRARFWLDRDERWGVEMDGAWRSPTSEPDMLVVPAAALCGPSCTAAARERGKKGNHRHEASVQMLPEPAGSTKKFKLLLLESC